MVTLRESSRMNFRRLAAGKLVLGANCSIQLPLPADLSICHSRFRLRFLAAAALAFALSATGFAFLTAGEPVSLPSLSALLLLTALAPPLAVRGVGLHGARETLQLKHHFLGLMESPVSIPQT